jgi:serine/threonine protein kinase
LFVLRLAKDFIDGLLAYQPQQRLTAEQALQHPWIVNSLTNDSRNPPNLISNVRRGLSSNPSFRSALETLGYWDEETDQIDSKKEAMDLDKKTQRKSLIGKHLKMVVGNKTA